MSQTPMQIVQAGLQHNKDQPAAGLAVRLDELAKKAEADRNQTDNPYRERIHLGMRDAYDHASHLVAQADRKAAAATNAALRALQLVRQHCGDEITGLLVPGDTRTLDAIVDQAIEGLSK